MRSRAEEQELSSEPACRRNLGRHLNARIPPSEDAAYKRRRHLACLLGSPLELLGNPWISLDLIGSPWISLDRIGSPWISLDLIGGAPLAHGRRCRRACALLHVSCCMCAAGCALLAVRCWLCAAGCALLAVSCWLCAAAAAPLRCLCAAACALLGLPTLGLGSTSPYPQLLQPLSSAPPALILSSSSP